MYHVPTRDEAQALADLCTERRRGMAAGPERTVTRYVVEQYPMGDDPVWPWGIVERWVYDDRPDLSEMGGAFVLIATARRIAGLD